MKIKKVFANNRKKCFEIVTAASRRLEYPYSRLRVKPSAEDGIADVHADTEVGGEGFTYMLASGKEDTILLDQVFDYNKDSDYLREMLLYKLSLKAKKLLEERGISKREVSRRLHTSPVQLYRLLDQTFTHKTIDQMIRLLAALDCPVDVVFKQAA